MNDEFGPQHKSEPKPTKQTQPGTPPLSCLEIGDISDIGAWDWAIVLAHTARVEEESKEEKHPPRACDWIELD